MKKTILFVDNIPDYLNVHALLLEQRGYHVIKAGSVAEAKYCLQQHNIHLAILDIRLEDDGDEQDISGLTLAQDEMYRYLPKLILTGHPSWEYAEKAMGAVLKGMNIVGMTAKSDDAEKIIAAIEAVFVEHVKVNWELDIHGRDVRLFTFPHLKVNLDNEALSLHVAEVEEVLRRLFLEHEQIFIDDAIVNLENKVLLPVSAFTKQGLEQQYLVVCGKRPFVLVDLFNYKQYMPTDVNYHPRVCVEAKTARYAAYAAVLANHNSLSEVRTFSEFYARHSSQSVVCALQHLLGVTLTHWYQESRSWQTEKESGPLFRRWFTEREIGETVAELEASIVAICEQSRAMGVVHLDDTAQWLSLKQSSEAVTLPNPLSLFAQDRLSLSNTVLYGTIHRQLNGRSILVDEQLHSWVIDYAHVQSGPLLQDFVSLECAIKYEMLPLFDFKERQEMEVILQTCFGEDTLVLDDALSAELAKAVQAILCVRQEARGVGVDMQNYRSGIILQSLSMIQTFDPTIKYTRRKLIPFVHALISAAMMYQAIGTSPHARLPAQAIYSLWIDEEGKEVWVEGKPVELTTQDFELLYYLYRHVNETCSRDQLLKEVFNLEHVLELGSRSRRMMSDPRVNSAINRLRKKIEPSASKPQYIQSVWGNGYKLVLKGVES